ncbi:MAG: hypothetical protein HOQ24_12035, partial [Mycobacteriaceae bacterium]|nr:hypothetical protein [Mycobacteriaceae bacterium]
GELRGNLAQAQDALQLAPAGALLLGSLAVLGIGVGLWPRLREYR